MSNPIFSVCVPVYKTEKFLNACVNSVLAQTFADFELILVDDGSPDNSGVLCDNYSYADSRIFSVHKENGGQLSARIAAVGKARGEYIVFLDSDDTLEPHALETIRDAFNQYNVDLVIYDMQRIVNGMVKPQNKLDEAMMLESKHDIFKFVLASSKYNSLCIKCFKKSAFSSIDYSKYFSIRHGEDLIQSIDLMNECHNAVVIPDILYNYTFNEQSVSNNANPMATPNFEVRSYVLKLLRELDFFSDADWEEYKEYCVGLLTTQIINIAFASATMQQKKKLFASIHGTEYYQTFLSTAKGRLKSLGIKKWIYVLFTKKMYCMVIWLANIYRIYQKTFKKS